MKFPAPASAEMNPQTVRDIYTVTRLNREVRAVLEGSFPPLWVQGEISNLARPASGHLYFSLKDKYSQVRCAMFKNRNQSLKFMPENGMEVLAMATVSLYESRGEFQLIINRLEPAGAGALQLAFEQLKERLRQEGLFETVHKKPIPSFPARIGIITSPSGAAIRDILHVLQRRYKRAEIIIYPTAVQGTEAAAGIESALVRAGRRKECDVLILARGGGSLEDLWSFNDERVARAIFNSAIPVVSGIGHETDFTIADFVADQRAPTPSAAAEMASPDQTKLLELLHQRKKTLHGWMRRILTNHQRNLDQYRRRLPDPARQLQNITQHIDEISMRMNRAIRSDLGMRRSHLSRLMAEIRQFNPVQKLRLYHSRCRHLHERLSSLMSYNLGKAANRLDSTSHTLHTVSPLATLDRGYAIVTDTDNGKILRDAGVLKPGRKVGTRLARGSFYATVTDIITDKHEK